MLRFLFTISLLLFFTSCDELTGGDDNSGKEPFKSMYNDNSQMILTPLHVGYKWVYEEIEYDLNGTATSTTYDTLEIVSSQTINGAKYYAYSNTEKGGIAFQNDTLFYGSKLENGVLEYGNLRLYISTKLRDAHDRHDGSAVYSTAGSDYELLGVVDNHRVKLLTGDRLVIGPTYYRDLEDEYAQYLFSDWRDDVATFFGLVDNTWYRDAQRTEIQSSYRLIEFTHPDFD